jgi:hypothetical protein
MKGELFQKEILRQEDEYYVIPIDSYPLAENNVY